MAKNNKKKTKNTKEEQIQLHGNVTLKLVKNNRVVKTIENKNTATNRMLYGIMLHLTNLDSQNINKYRPNYMGVGSGDSTNETLEIATLVSLEDPIGNLVDIDSRSPVRDEEHNRVTGALVGLFTYSMVGEAVIREIGLFATDDTATLLARVKVNSLQLSPGMSLIVEWNLGLENKVV